MKKLLFIAEKPSVMRTVESAYQHNKALIESRVGELTFVSLAGHVCKWMEASDYPQWKGRKWHERDLPLFPNPYVVVPIKDKLPLVNDIKQKLKSGQFGGIIVGTDSDQEGNGIYYLLSEYLKIPKSMPAYRYFESSLTDAEITNSLLHMTDFYKNPRDVHMTDAFLVRSRGDWELGMNMTVAVTNARGKLFRVGRVKAPTLKLVYDNSSAIANFKPHSDYLARVSYRDGFSGVLVEDGEPKAFPSEADARRAAMAAGQGPAIVEGVERKAKRTPPPKLFNLSTLQAVAGVLYHYNPQKTLDLVQGLYERRLLSYPRTGGEYISSEKAKTLPALMRSAAAVPEYRTVIGSFTGADYRRMAANPRIVDDKKVAEESHDALLPTTEAPDFAALGPDEQNIYRLVAGRLVTAFLPDCEKRETALTASVNGLTFRSASSETVVRGWTEYAQGAAGTKAAKSEAIPATIRQGDRLTVTGWDAHEKKSKPPKRLTSASLVYAMEHIAKYVSDPTLRAALADAKGIGQQATRAKIINDLITSKYIREDKKNGNLFITDDGKAYVEALSGFTIMDPVQTAKWEMLFDQVRKGTATREAASAEFQKYVMHVIEEAKMETVVEDVKCPYCGGKIVKRPTGYACESRSCRFFVNNAGGQVTETDIRDLVNNGQTRIIPGILMSKNGGKPLNAGMKLNPQGSEYTTSFMFEHNADQDLGIKCPYCGRKVRKTPFGFACEDRSCGFSVNDFHGRVKEKDIRDLVENGQTGVLTLHSDRKNKDYSARLILNPKGAQYATALSFS